MSRYLSIESVGMVFETRKGPFTALQDISLEIRQGEFVTLIGHSGCGKSTLLNLVTGLLKATAGNMILAGREISGPGPDRGVVFQNHSLLPWLTCFENVYLAVERVFAGQEPRARLKDRTKKALELVHLGHAMHKYPHEVSGGMKQRVGIARALSIEPKIMLMDEPFSALDALTRGTLQDEVRRICTATGQTVFMITHDVDEAIYLADKIVLMTNGPGAVLAEIVDNPLPRDRVRTGFHKHPLYYGVRNHIVDFLVTRSRAFSRDNHDPRNVPVVRPTLPEPIPVPGAVQHEVMHRRTGTATDHDP